MIREVSLFISHDTHHELRHAVLTVLLLPRYIINMYSCSCQEAVEIRRPTVVISARSATRIDGNQRRQRLKLLASLYLLCITKEPVLAAYRMKTLSILVGPPGDVSIGTNFD